LRKAFGIFVISGYIVELIINPKIKNRRILMKQLSSFSILFTFVLLFMAPSLATASIAEEATKIPYQINNSDRIVIGTVREIHTYDTYTVNTITVKEWLYNPLPTETIKVITQIGTNLRVEDEAEFTLHESVLLMLKDVDIDKQLFRVPLGLKYSVSDRDEVIKELKAQGKWKGENQTGNQTNETGTIENTQTAGEQEENQTENKTNNTGMIANTGAEGKQKGKSNAAQTSNSTPFISSLWVLAAVLGAVMYVRKLK
jgi:hypothetical protein